MTTLAESDALDLNGVLDGHQAARRGDREPGSSRPRGYWFGWRSHMMAIGAIPVTREHLELVKALRLRIVEGVYNQVGRREAGRRL